VCNTFQALYIEQHYKAIAIICALQAHNNVGNRNETSCSVQSPEFIFRRISVSFSTSWTGAFICSLLSFYLYSLISVFGITVRSFTQSSVGLSRNVNKNSSEQHCLANYQNRSFTNRSRLASFATCRRETDLYRKSWMCL